MVIDTVIKKGSSSYKRAKEHYIIRMGGQVREFKPLQAEKATEIKSFWGRCFTHQTKNKRTFVSLPNYVFSPSVVIVVELSSFSVLKSVFLIIPSGTLQCSCRRTTTSEVSIGVQEIECFSS